MDGPSHASSGSAHLFHGLEDAAVGVQRDAASHYGEQTATLNQAIASARRHNGALRGVQSFKALTKTVHRFKLAASVLKHSSPGMLENMRRDVSSVLHGTLYVDDMLPDPVEVSARMEDDPLLRKDTWHPTVEQSKSLEDRSQLTPSHVRDTCEEKTSRPFVQDSSSATVRIGSLPLAPSSIFRGASFTKGAFAGVEKYASVGNVRIPFDTVEIPASLEAKLMAQSPKPIAEGQKVYEAKYGVKLGNDGFAPTEKKVEAPAAPKK